MTFFASYRNLDESDALLLRLLCWLPPEFRDRSGHVNTGLAAAASGRPRQETREAMTRLAESRLAERFADDEFGVHAAYESFMREVTPGLMKNTEQDAVSSRMRAWRAAQARQAGRGAAAPPGAPGPGRPARPAQQPQPSWQPSGEERDG